MPDVGVPGMDVGVEAGVSVIREDGRLQDDTPMTATRLAIQKRFLILSSFSIGIVIAGLIIGNSLSVGNGGPSVAVDLFTPPQRRALKF
jgi:hypothetical protein